MPKKQINNEAIDVALKHAAEDIGKIIGRKNIVILVACADEDKPLVFLRPASKKITITQLSAALFRLIGRLYNHMELVEYQKAMKNVKGKK